MAISRITIEGYKSIKSLKDFELKNLNVLIGANGSGKSNFISFFRMLGEMVEQRLQIFIGKGGGADDHFFMGTKQSERVLGGLYFGLNGYEFSLVPTVDNRVIIENESIFFHGPYFGDSDYYLGVGKDEAKLKLRYQKALEKKKNGEHLTADYNSAIYVYPEISRWTVYHFHDTSDSAKVKQDCSLSDNEFLRRDGSNLAAFLYWIEQKHNPIYKKICHLVSQVLPGFKSFFLSPSKLNEDRIALRWVQQDSDYIFKSTSLSDGSLRFICLTTALLQPSPPSTMIVDEPELGLHPTALTLLAALISKVSQDNQLIIATQSPLLIDHFDPQSVIVVDRNESESTFNRVDGEELKTWLEDYSLGEIWQKNIIGGRPNS